MLDTAIIAGTSETTSVVIGAIIGAAASIGSTTLADLLRHRRETAALEASLVAEVQALLDLIESRKYVDLLEDICRQYSEGDESAVVSLSVAVPQDYARVYQANAHQVGRARKHLVENVVRFHMLVEAVAQDVRPGGALSQGGTRSAFVADLFLLKEAVRAGQAVVHAR